MVNVEATLSFYNVVECHASGSRGRQAVRFSKGEQLRRRGCNGSLFPTPEVPDPQRIRHSGRVEQMSGRD
jgi:hypothetical protein